MPSLRALASLSVLLAAAGPSSAQVARPDHTLSSPGSGAGASVALSGERALVGAPGAAQHGAAQVFERQADGSWSPGVLLVPADASTLHSHGMVIALDADRAALASRQFGYVTLFERQSDGTWLEGATVTAPTDPPGLGYSLFGTAIALDGDRLFVVASMASASFAFGPGRLVCYERQPSGTWNAVANVQSSSTPAFEFGRSMALSGDRVVVGASTNAGAGAVFVYEGQPGGPWAEVATLPPPVAGAGQRFGESVHLDGDRLVVGAPLDDTAGADAGALHVFERGAGGTWALVQSIWGDGAGHRLGASINGDGPWLVAAAPGSPVEHPSIGAVQVYHLTAAGLYERRADVAHEYAQSPTELGGIGGRGLAVEGDRAIFGTPSAIAHPGDLSDAAHVIELGTLFHGDVELSLSAGGAQSLLPRAGAEAAGRIWWMLGSLSGTAPGIPLGAGVTLPLVADAYTDLAFGLALPIVPAIGVLDASGAADTAFAFAAGAPAALVGLSIHHAYLTIDPVTGAFGASNAVELVLTP